MIDKAQVSRADGPTISTYTLNWGDGGAPPARLPDGTPRALSSPRGGFGSRGRGAFSGRGRGAPPGSLLRRRAPSLSSDNSQGERFPRGGGATRGRGRGGREGRGGRRPQRRNNEPVDQMDPVEEAGIEEKIYGSNGVGKEPLVYNPQQLNLKDFQADWPNTPLSALGLVGSVHQKAEVLASRLPHGYVSPDQLAERFQKGELVRFESIEERDKVLAKAAELAKARSDILSDRKGEAIPAEDMTFLSIGAEEEKDIASKMGRGLYPQVEKQRIPFLDTVMRGLKNNGTYHNSKQDEFMAKIASLLPQQGAGGKAGQQEKSA